GGERHVRRVLRPHRPLRRRGVLRRVGRLRPRGPPTRPARRGGGPGDRHDRPGSRRRHPVAPHHAGRRAALPRRTPPRLRSRLPAAVRHCQTGGMGISTGEASARLSPQTRAAALEAMASTDLHGAELDVLVVGGGVVGVGTALDAVTRGLSVGLIEQRDLASGTSSRSSKLVHGGLRYLEMLDFGLVREALEERGLLLTRLAPHLVRPVPFLYPLHRAWQRPYVGAGLALYDAMAAAGAHPRGLPTHRHLGRRQVARIAPDLRTEELSGAIRYHDAQVDDGRLVLTIARTAAHHGAHVATRTRVVGFLREGERGVGARARDLEPGRELGARARGVVNAPRGWTDEIQELVGGRGALHVQASKGIHLVVPRDRIRSEVGFITKTAVSVLFVIPWGRHWIIGTTDTPWEFDLAHPAASRADIDYVLDHVNAILREPLRPEERR